MRKPAEKEWDLTIGPDTVRLFVLKAKAISAALNHEYEAGGEHEIEIDDQSRDAHHHDGLAEEEEVDLTEKELRALIDDLNMDEAAELIAIMWIGRGDFDASEWSDALAEAREALMSFVAEVESKCQAGEPLPLTAPTNDAPAAPEPPHNVGDELATLGSGTYVWWPSMGTGRSPSLPFAAGR